MDASLRCLDSSGPSPLTFKAPVPKLINLRWVWFVKMKECLKAHIKVFVVMFDTGYWRTFPNLNVFFFVFISSGAPRWIWPSQTRYCYIWFWSARVKSQVSISVWFPSTLCTVQTVFHFVCFVHQGWLSLIIWYKCGISCCCWSSVFAAQVKLWFVCQNLILNVTFLLCTILVGKSYCW